MNRLVIEVIIEIIDDCIQLLVLFTLIAFFIFFITQLSLVSALQGLVAMVILVFLQRHASMPVIRWSLMFLIGRVISIASCTCQSTREATG
jgi:hypothetical protein